jgi:glutamate 5-kinase
VNADSNAVPEVLFKVGSGCFVDEQGVIVQKQVDGIAANIMEFCAEFGMKPVGVTSGAVAGGVQVFRELGKDPELASKRSLAAAGSHRIGAAWDEAFSPFGEAIGLVLVTHKELDDLGGPHDKNQGEGATIRATHRELREDGLMPFYNQNDPVAQPTPDNELNKLPQGTENDALAMHVAMVLGIKVVFFLTHMVEGVEKDGVLQRQVYRHQIQSLRPYLYEASEEGSGGMADKLEYADVLVRARRKVFIGNYRAKYSDIYRNARGTQVLQLI